MGHAQRSDNILRSEDATNTGKQTWQNARQRRRSDTLKKVHMGILVEEPLSLDPRLLDVLKSHKQLSEYTQPTDWMFASPDRREMLPRSYTCFYEKLGKACQDAGIKHVSPHSFRQSYRHSRTSLGPQSACSSVRCVTATSG